LKNKINIFSNNKIKFFLTELFSDYELIFMDLDMIEIQINSTNANIIFINEEEASKLINFKKLSDNFLILSSSNNINLNTNNKIIKTPTTINHIKNTIENFLENLKIQFHDIIIFNEKLTNSKNNSFCYLTKLESEILTHLIIEKESTKNHIKENILNIKSTIQTNSLDSHLTRIRKKMIQIKTSIKIQSKSEKLLIVI
tara:strand:+ start:675 stop:1271 length:597 start_codon:yes stop_codon:yes gene_type:complete